MRARRAVALLAAMFFALSAQAGSSLSIVVRVSVSSGACGTAVTEGAVSVSCASFANLPTLPPVASALSRAAAPAFVGANFGAGAPPFVPAGLVEQAGATSASPVLLQPAVVPGLDAGPSGSPLPGQRDPGWIQPDEVPPDEPAQDESPAVQVGLLPVLAAGRNPTRLYSRGANLSSWRVVSNDNVQHVELTIAW